MVRDQEVEGSNPSAPTKQINNSSRLPEPGLEADLSTDPQIKNAAFFQYSRPTHIRFLVLFTIFEHLKFPNRHIPDFQKLVDNTR